MNRLAPAAVTAALSCLLAAFVPPAASAQESAPQCGPRAVGAEFLYRMHGESPVLIAALPDGRYFEVFAHPPSGSWTMLIVMPGDIACVVASGEGWEAMKPRAPGEKGA